MKTIYWAHLHSLLSVPSVQLLCQQQQVKLSCHLSMEGKEGSPVSNTYLSAVNVLLSIICTIIITSVHFAINE